MPCVPTEYLFQQILINAKAGTPTPGLAGIFTGSKMGLYKTNVGLSQATLLADLTPANYNTYVTQNAVFGTPYRRATGGLAIASALLLWQMTDALVPNVIYGYYIVDSGGTNLLLAESFGTDGINLVDTLSGFSVASEFCLGGVNFGQMALAF